MAAVTSPPTSDLSEPAGRETAELDEGQAGEAQRNEAESPAGQPSSSTDSPPPHDRVLTTVEILSDGPPQDRLTSWLVTIAITLFAFGIRFVNLARPKNLVFDETYYSKDAWSLLHFGYERDWVDGANDKIAAGQVSMDLFKDSAAFAVHPPLGKWLIAGGEWLFGMNSFGWRFAALVFGSLLIAVTIRLARRLSRSTFIGALAGLLLSLDGLAFVMSRTALLDIFQAFFLVAAVACVVADRDWFRHRLADHLRQLSEPDLAGRYGPRLLIRPWRILAGLMFGLSIAVKWNSVFVLAAFGVMSVIWDVSARRTAGAKSRSWRSILGDGVPAFVFLVLLAVPVYIATWAGWLVTQGGYARQWGAQLPKGSDQASWLVRHHDLLVSILGAPLASLMWLHREIYNFHTGSYMAEQTHVYEANPAGWLVMVRPIGIDAVNDIKPGVDGCTAVNDTCLRVISGQGTPLLWWAAAIALIAALVFWIAGRDWRFGVPALAALTVYLPWFRYDDRPLFFFYAICIIPFTVTILAMCLGKILGPPGSGHRRRIGAAIAGSVVALIAANFAFLYPILTDELLTRTQWMARMWFRSWI